MSDYTKGTNFAAKDALLTGDANKVVSGTEIDDEFGLARTAINSKADETGGILNTCDINDPDLDGGSIDGCTIGSNSPVTTLTVDNINVNGNTISSTDTDGNIVLTPNGNGVVDINAADIDGGNIDNTTIGGATPAVVTATTLNATDVAVDTSVLVVDGTTNNNVGIGTASPDASYKLDVSGDVRATNYYGNGSNLTELPVGYSWTDAGTLSSGSTKDLSIDTTNATQIVVLVSGLQGSGDTTNDAWQVRLGTSGGVVETGYHGGFTANNSADSGGTTSAFTLIERYGSASETTCIIKLFNPTGNEWFLEANSYQDGGSGAYNAQQYGAVAAGHISLGGALTTVQLRAFGGSFTAGEIYYGVKEY